MVTAQHDQSTHEPVVVTLAETGQRTGQSEHLLDAKYYNALQKTTPIPHTVIQ
jgi:hypothetical protein